VLAHQFHVEVRAVAIANERDGVVRVGGVPHFVLGLFHLFGIVTHFYQNVTVCELRRGKLLLLELVFEYIFVLFDQWLVRLVFLHHWVPLLLFAANKRKNPTSVCANLTDSK
jgi:hypothetical protein